MRQKQGRTWSPCFADLCSWCWGIIRSPKPGWLRWLCGIAGTVCLLCVGAWLALGLVTPPPLLQGVSLSSVVLDHDDQLLRIGLSKDDKYRIYTPPHELAPQSVQAVLLYEDKYFYQHMGVNPLAVGRAVWSMLLGGRRVGGSTITMQVARLRLGLQTTSLEGKLRQMWYALLYERHYSKSEILTAYFTLAPYGGNIEGLAAAARIYFKTDVGRLSLGQILALVSVPQNPVQRSPLGGRDFAFARKRMHTLWESATGDAVPLMPLRVYTPQDLPFKAPHVAAELLEYGGMLPPAVVIDAIHGRSAPASSSTAEGATAATAPPPQNASTAVPLPGSTHVQAGGSAGKNTEDTATQANEASFGKHATSVKTEIVNPHVYRLHLRVSLQQAIEGVLRSFAARNASYGINNAAALVVHWPDMQIHSLVGSADFHATNISGQVDGTRARRSPGSVLKPFIYALALEQGLIHPRTLLPDAPRSFAGYTPENFDQVFRGPVAADEALRASRNIPAVWLAARLQPDLWTFLQRAGAGFPHDANYYGLALVLGGAEVSMRQVAEWYAMLANGGVWRPLQMYEGQASVAGLSLLSPEVAHVSLRMLEDSSRMLTSARSAMPLRCKTGTSNGFRDAWTAGIVGQYVVVVWVGNFDNRANNLLVGGTIAEPLFEDVARQLQRHTQLRDLLAEQVDNLRIRRISVCADTGDIDTSLCPVTVDTWFVPGRSPTVSSGIYRKILVDSATGLRLCAPKGEGVRYEIHQFWPSDMRELFAQAGIAKPLPPALAPECGAVVVQGKAPRIISPAAGVEYVRRVSDPARGRIPLKAAVDADASTVYWFCGTRSIGSSRADAVLLWQAEDGTHTIRAVDDLGRSTEQKVRVKTVP